MRSTYKVSSEVILSLSILMLFAVYNFTGLFLFLLLGMAVWVCAALFVPAERFFLVSVFLIPSISWLKAIGQGDALYGYVFLLFVIKYLCKKRIIKLPVIFIVHTMSVFVTTLLNKNWQLLPSLLRFLMFLIFIVNFYNTIISRDYKYRCLRLFSIGAVMNLLVGMIYASLNGTIYSGFFGGIRDDRNYFAAGLAAAVAISLYLVLHSEYKKQWLALTVLLFGGILTNSRTFLLAMSFCLMMVLLSMRKSKTIIRVFGLFTLTLLCVVLFWGEISPALNMLLRRFSEDNIATGNNRFTAWAYYLQRTFSSLESALFGSGYSKFYLASISKDIRIVEHNTFVQAISTLGLVGSVTLFFCFSRVFRTIAGGG